MPSIGSISMTFALFVVGLTVLIHFGWFSVALALKVGAILIGLSWLYVLVKIPWDLYFRARHGRQDGDDSLQAGIVIDDQVLDSLRLYERRLLSGALFSHVVSALLVGIFSHLAPEFVNPGFVWLFALSVVVRPAGELYGYLATRIAELTQRTRYPREDVLVLRERVRSLEMSEKAMRQELHQFQQTVQDQLGRQDRRIGQAEQRESANHLLLRERIHQLSQEMENLVTKVSEDKELIAGVKAFARMFREQRI